MKRRARVLFILLLMFACLAGAQSGFAQMHQVRLDQGIKFYRVGQWVDAAVELLLSQRDAHDSSQLAASLYWLSLTEFAMGEYDAALRDINELQRITPAGMRMDDIIFYKGRALFYLERPAEALPLFRSYGAILDRQDTPGIQAEKTVLSYWIGECLYAMGQQEQAAAQFTEVVNARPRSEKYEAAAYRLALIEQEGIAKELLGTMSVSYTEYLEALEEYQRLLAEAEMQIQALEAGLGDRAAESPAADFVDPDPADTIQRLRELKDTAEKLRNEIRLME
jgi:tetratricopeptide (TPR) repeat protein